MVSFDCNSFGVHQDSLFTTPRLAIMDMPTRGLEPRTRRLVVGCSIRLSYVGRFSRTRAASLELAGGVIQKAFGRPKVTLFSWPLSRGLTAEVRFIGDDVQPAHLELLSKYLELAKNAVRGDEDDEARRAAVAKAAANTVVTG